MNTIRANIRVINQVMEMFDRHKKGIINAIQTGAKNIGVERSNGSIQELKTIGRGDKTGPNYITAILFSNRNLQFLSLTP